MRGTSSELLPRSARPAIDMSPKNLSEAVSSTIELELYLPREQSVQTVNETESEPATTLESQVAPIQAVSNPSLLQQLLDHIEKLEMSGPRLKQLPRAQQRPLQPCGTPREITCYRCGMPDNYARGCAAGRSYCREQTNQDYKTELP